MSQLFPFLICDLMNKDTKIQHIALNYNNGENAKIFFTKILGIPLIKSSELSNDLSKLIFHIDEKVIMEYYDNGSARFEIFISNEQRGKTYNHICIEIKDKTFFYAKCKEYGLNQFIVNKGDVELLFVRDFSDNLFEIKEQ